ncbi:DNA-binding IclR family transcriptional regulator [Paraburkholderia sp. GAS199]|uniref:IclR family transcriptional regulator n=1 Tax=Paraburkholderia sp. GAS199 TaxID=3035126 RepID=UPI003D213A1C
MKKSPKTTPDTFADSALAATPERERRQRVQSATTAVVLLKGLAALGGRASLTALASYVNESPAKVHRYMVSLMEESLVAQQPLTQMYVLGPECLAIGLAAMRIVDPIREAEPSLVLLRETLEVTCFVAVMGNRGPTIVRFEEPGLPVTVNVRVGSVMSVLWSATGRVFLGLLDESRIRAMAEHELQHAPADLRDQLDHDDPIGALKSEVQSTRCAAVKDTNLKGISAVSAPLFDFNGRLCGTLTALGATGGFDSSLDAPIAAAVRREAQVISARLGFAG